MNLTIQGHQVPSLFGNGIVGSAMNGLIRIPAFLANCAAVMVIGELAIRLLSGFLTAVGFEPKEGTWVDKITKHVSGVVGEFRPYGNRETYNTKKLIVRLIAFAAFSIIATELARLIAGPTPPIYNKVLTFLGPLRLDGGSWLGNVRALF
jgi:hypothetical protein